MTPGTPLLLTRTAEEIAKAHDAILFALAEPVLNPWAESEEAAESLTFALTTLCWVLDCQHQKTIHVHGCFEERLARINKHWEALGFKPQRQGSQ